MKIQEFQTQPNMHLGRKKRNTIKMHSSARSYQITITAFKKFA